MDLVHQYVWFVIGGTALITFLLAWIIRGIVTTGRRRRAIVERDIALTELEQVRAELDSLYAAQRRQRETRADPSHLEELRQRDERLAYMAHELEAAQTQLHQAREEARAVPAEPEPDPRLEEAEARNAWLEERVHELEGMVHALGKKTEEQRAALDAQQSAPAPTPAPTPAPETAPDPEAEKHAWQVGYLKTRIATLEAKLIEAEEREPEIQEAPEAAEPPAAVDEELARLRWRNRYLEGRLAYYEEMPENTPAQEKTQAEQTPAAPVKVAPAAPVIPAPAAAEDADDAASSDDDEQPEPVLDAREDQSDDDGDESAEHPAEKMLRALEAADDDGAGAEAADAAPAVDPEEPKRLDRPQGAPDDLTLISGIGPRIQTILNELGIWHFSQIASWTPANEAWIDQHLNFAGRVSRENWISQAGEFISANAGV